MSATVFVTLVTHLFNIFNSQKQLITSLMGRERTGSWTTDECLRIELSFLLKKRYLVRGVQTSGSLAWNRNGQPSGNISIISSWLTGPNSRPYIRLIYTVTDKITGEKQNHDNTVYLEARPSNLGVGEVMYFICPSSGQRCRILYRAYDCSIWKSRQAYQHRIYYPSQQSSKRQYANNRFWQLDKQIEKLKGKRVLGTYMGKTTKRAKRLKRLKLEQWEYDNRRWLPESYPLSLRNALFDGKYGSNNEDG